MNKSEAFALEVLTIGNCLLAIFNVITKNQKTCLFGLGYGFAVLIYILAIKARPVIRRLM